MISLNWVGDYIDIKDQDVNELALKITKAGINVEGVITHHIDNLVIGKILSVVHYIGRYAFPMTLKLCSWINITHTLGFCSK